MSEISNAANIKEEAPAEKAAPLPVNEEAAPAVQEAPQPAEAEAAPAPAPAPAPTPMPAADSAAPKTARKKFWKKLHEHEKDIRYRGPLSYRGLRILAWIFVIFTQIALLIRLDMRIDPAGAPAYGDTPEFLRSFSDLILPLFLLANFSTILSHRDSYHRQLIRFGGLSAAVIIFYLLIYQRYFIGITTLLMGNPQDAERLLEKIASLLFGSRFFTFNLFLDLFLCALFMFFLMARPRKFFTGKRVLILRLGVLLPIAYEVACILLKISAGMGRIVLPPWSFPFLTTKPPMMFIVFMVLALFIKRRERKFLKNGMSHEDYRQFLKTKRNSWHFSLHAAVVFLIAAFLDIVIMLFAAVVLAVQSSGSIDSAPVIARSIYASGLGGATSLLRMIPIVLLFSYTRTPRRPAFDQYLPAIGIFMILMVYIEGTYQAAIKGQILFPDIVHQLGQLLMFFLSGVGTG